MDRWQHAKVQADLENCFKLNPDSFDEEESPFPTYREQYIDPDKPTVTKLNYIKPTFWQIFRNYVCSFFFPFKR